MSSIIFEPPALATATAHCRYHRIELDAGKSLVSAELSPRGLFDRLLEAGHLADARRVLAHCLSKRRALWWGALCAWEACRPEPTAEASAALAAVARFVIEPSEENRRTAETTGHEAGLNTLAGCLAMAAFHSGGSIAPAELEPVLPEPFITGRLVGVAVYLASVAHEPAGYLQRMRQFLALGVEIARGENLWPTTLDRTLTIPLAGRSLPVLAPFRADPHREGHGLAPGDSAVAQEALIGSKESAYESA